jgi:hypothetical protein
MSLVWLILLHVLSLEIGQTIGAQPPGELGYGVLQGSWSIPCWALERHPWTCLGHRGVRRLSGRDHCSDCQGALLSSHPLRLGRPFVQPSEWSFGRDVGLSYVFQFSIIHVFSISILFQLNYMHTRLSYGRIARLESICLSKPTWFKMIDKAKHIA